MSAARPIRPYAVLNGYGEQLGTFATWEDAHSWGHLAAGEPNCVLPIQVEDREHRVTRLVTVDRCELIAWSPFARISGCDARLADRAPLR